MSYKLIILEGYFAAMLSAGIGLKSELLNILETYAGILLKKNVFGQIFKNHFESSSVNLLSPTDTAKLNE